MRDFITVTALVVSLSGVVVSLAREEVRCYLGLNAESCQVKQPESPGSNLQEASSGSSEKIRDRKSSDAIPNAPEPALSSSQKSLSKDPLDQALPPNPDSQTTPENPAPDNQPATVQEMAPAHTELKAAPEVSSPVPSAEQPVSAQQGQNNQASSDSSSSNIPLTVEPYSPQQPNH